MFYLYLYYIPILSWILVAVLSLHWHLASNVVTFGSKFTSFNFQICVTFPALSPCGSQPGLPRLSTSGFPRGSACRGPWGRRPLWPLWWQISFTFTCAAFQKLLDIGYGRSVVLPTLWGASYGHHYYGKRWSTFIQSLRPDISSTDVSTVLSNCCDSHPRSAEPEPHHGYYGFGGYRGLYGYRGWYGRKKRFVMSQIFQSWTMSYLVFWPITNMTFVMVMYGLVCSKFC